MVCSTASEKDSDVMKARVWEVLSVISTRKGLYSERIPGVSGCCVVVA